jgi:hypothetical protein
MDATGRRLLDHRTFWSSLLVILAGMILLGILPLLMSDIRHRGIPYLLIPHLGVMLLVAGSGLHYIYTLTRSVRWSPVLSICALAVPAVSMIILARPPAVEEAAISHYLTLPKWWIDSGAMKPSLWYAPSLYPFLPGLAFLEPIARGRAELISLYLALHLVTLSMLVGRFVEHRTHRRESAWLACVFTVSLPLCVRATTTPWPDLLATLFVTIACILLVDWIEAGGLRQLWLGGAALGLAAGCSSGGALALLAVPLALFFGARSQGTNGWRALGASTSVFVIAILTLSPWLIRSGIWLSNPFFPLFGRVFGSEALIVGTTWRPALEHGLLHLGETGARAIVAPLVAVLLPHEGIFGRYDLTGGILTLGALFAFIRYRGHPWVIFFGLTTLFFLLLGALFRLEASRVYLPLALPLITMTILGLGALGTFFKRRFERAFIGTIFATYLVIFTLDAAHRIVAFGALAYRGDTVSYLRRNLPHYPIVETINHAVGRDEYVYNLLATSALAYVQPRVITGGVEQDAQILVWLRNAATTQMLAQEFIHRGIHYLAVDTAQVEARIITELTPRELALWSDFKRAHLTPIDAAGAVELHRISAAPASPPR